MIKSGSGIICNGRAEIEFSICRRKHFWEVNSSYCNGDSIADPPSESVSKTENK